jgi:hypothetical protein
MRKVAATSYTATSYTPTMCVQIKGTSMILTNEHVQAHVHDAVMLLGVQQAAFGASFWKDCPTKQEHYEIMSAPDDNSRRLDPVD